MKPNIARLKLVRDDTVALSETIAKLEGEINARFASLYGWGREMKKGRKK